MGNIFDDELDEYAEQQGNTPTVPASVPTAAPQQKSAEQAELEKILAVIKGIKESQGEVRKTVSDIEDIADRAEKAVKALNKDLKEARPLWDELLKSYTSEILISDESFAGFRKVMKSLTDQILVSTCSKIDKAVSDNVAGQFSEVANRHIQEFDEKMKVSIAEQNKALADLKKDYNDNIASLEEKQGKLLAQAVEEQNRIILPSGPFWTMMLVFITAIIGGLTGWYKFWRTPGNDESMNWMVGAIIAEFMYYGTMLYNHFAYRDEQKTKTDKKKKDDNEPKIYSVSLSEAIYLILLSFSSLAYITWGQLDVKSSATLLIYLLPLVIASNFLWLMIRGLLYGIFQKD